ncbi:lytic transglycosylase domain-containing protein [Breoghania sp.]|uniref:lytic transglycosylase domain-containing protein n=1 Tax=Breoghania sp. TaxID=2065378 RepID=UPI0026312B57|nr:lytic transglycosylase domain-containing protein [Breoghania sp.]MDJ0933671.1 lytic transglycosylase domain-containing protein [Breoghania sp.]
MKVAETPSITSRIALTFQSASFTTGTDFEYLVKMASRESSFDTDAKASTSSATGLFQFIESTWLETVKTTGAKHGLGEYADDITQRADGSYTVSSAARRREILNLRKDPQISAMMASEFTRKNATYMENKLDRQPSDGELYAAHFLGAGGASKLIQMAENDTDRAADQVFPRQARANKSIFYDQSGSARSVSDVLDSLVAQHDSPELTEYATVCRQHMRPSAVSKPVPTPVAKAQAIAVAAGVPDAGGGGTGAVIASRYYRPEESEVLLEVLSDALTALSENFSDAMPAATTADETTEGTGIAQAQTVAAATGTQTNEVITVATAFAVWNAAAAACGQAGSQ